MAQHVQRLPVRRLPEDALTAALVRRPAAESVSVRTVCLTADMDDASAEVGAVPLGHGTPVGVGLLEAASWALAARLARRHPRDLRIFHGRPGGGQSDVLWLRSPTHDPNGGDIRLNRDGRVHVITRFDTLAPPDEAGPVHYTWQTVLRANSFGQHFTAELERAAGLTAPHSTPAATETTLTWRTIACLLSVAATTELGLTVEPGFYDDNFGSPSPHYDAFPAIPSSATDARPEDPLGISGYRFWFVLQDQRPVVALEQTSASAWVAGESTGGVDLMAGYRKAGRAAGLLSVTGDLAARAKLRLH